MKKIRVLIAEDHALVREGLRKLLELEGDIEVIGEARNGRQAVAMSEELSPAVVLMDISMPMLNGLEATRRILKADPAIKVLILSAYKVDEFVRTAAESGAVGYLLKQSFASEVRQALRAVHCGKIFSSPSVAGRFERFRLLARGLAGRTGKNSCRLTPRETEVLQLVAEGKANKEAASGLGIGVKTIQKHREHLMEKLDIHDTAGLTRYAITMGIIESAILLRDF